MGTVLIVMLSKEEIPVSKAAFRSRISPAEGTSVSMINSSASVASERLPAKSLVLKVISYGAGELSSALSIPIVTDASSDETWVLSDRIPLMNKISQSFVASATASPVVRPEML